MITLNEIAYNIKNLAYGGKPNVEANLTTSQIKYWVHYHRAKLIADNLDKGILSNHILWQNYELNAGNMLDSVIMQGNIDASAFTGSDLNRWTNIPKDATPQALDRWTLDSTLTSKNDALTPYLKDSHSLSQYGNYKKVSQFKNDYRNISQAGFTIPEPLMLKDYKSIKSIELDRVLWTVDDSVYVRSFEPIILPIKTLDEGMYSKHNRFTSDNKPYATLERVDFNDNIHNTTALILKGLQVTPGNQEDQSVFWSYKANARMILADPTKASPSWDDSKTPYPIPMEYVSDLTQRVISQEMGVAIKTPVDDIEDNLDTTKMMREKGGA